MSKIFECEMCQKEYSDVDENYVPRLLSCGHTRCHTCAIKLVIYFMFCPFCRQPIEAKDVNDLPINFNLAGVCMHGESHLSAGELFVTLNDLRKREQKLKGGVASVGILSKCTYNDPKQPNIEHKCTSKDKLMCEACEEFGIHQGHKKRLLILDMNRVKVIFKQKIEDMEKNCPQYKTYIEKIDEAVKNDEILLSTKFREVQEHFTEIRQLVSEQENKVIDEIKKEASKTLQINDGRKNDMIEAQRDNVESLEQIKKQIEVNESDLYLSNINLSWQMGRPNPRILYTPALTKALGVKLPNFKFEDDN